MIELNGENYLTGNEACHLLSVKPSTLYTYVSRGVLRSYKRGIKRQSLYKQVELEALLQLRPSTSPSPTTDAGVGEVDDRHHIPHAEDWVPNV
jgi:excisionase family DNA binding protein